MVAVIVLIGMIMIIAGVLAAGLPRTAPEEPRDAGIDVKGVNPDSDKLTFLMKAGPTYQDSYYLKHDGENTSIEWNRLELRIAGEEVDANVLKATEDGDAINLDATDDTIWREIPGGDNVTIDNFDFSIGDIIRLENIDPEMNEGDTLTIIWNPGDRLLFSEEV